MQFIKLSDCINYYQTYQLTKHKYEWRAKHLQFFDVVPLSDLKKFHIKQYHIFRQSQGVSNATINREISFARAAINCVNNDNELQLYNAFCHSKFIENDVIPHFLTLGQYEALLKKSLEMGYHDLHDFIVLLTMTGCRPSEIYSLTWDNVYLDRHYFIVRNCWSKSKRTMFKYLNEAAMELLASRLANRAGDWVFMNTKTKKPMGSYHKIFNKVRSQLDFYCTFYELRHTYASWLVQGSVSIYTVKELLGHRDIASTMRYAHLDYATKCEALKVIG